MSTPLEFPKQPGRHGEAQLFDVRVPMIHPVNARVGDVIAVRQGHPERPVVVVRHIDGAWQPIAVGANADAIRKLETVGVLSPVRS